MAVLDCTSGRKVGGNSCCVIGAGADSDIGNRTVLDSSAVHLGDNACADIGAGCKFASAQAAGRYGSVDSMSHNTAHTHIAAGIAAVNGLYARYDSTVGITEDTAGRAV